MRQEAKGKPPTCSPRPSHASPAPHRALPAGMWTPEPLSPSSAHNPASPGEPANRPANRGRTDPEKMPTQGTEAGGGHVNREFQSPADPKCGPKVREGTGCHELLVGRCPWHSREGTRRSSKARPSKIQSSSSASPGAACRGPVTRLAPTPSKYLGTS